MTFQLGLVTLDGDNVSPTRTGPQEQWGRGLS